MREIKFRFVYKNKILDILTLKGISDRNYHWADDVVVEQYTGLKDKNDKEICEGDIVRDYDEGYLYKVIYNDYDAQFQFYDPVDDNYYSNNDLAEHEIIGNIHETPELLK
jgi:uncharacterized phage protein (TIGR01671 family)